ncbi:MAG: type VI secretion system membrane subunit TssM [Chitinispirillaceae bacterium]|nr:type VI secretion system membrane subunit TssM [Chitinispirillaceae bacterium]
MKRISPLKIVFWSLLAALGIAGIVLALALPALSALFWLLAMALLLGDSTWFCCTLLLGRKRKAKGPGLFVGNQGVFQRIMRETSEATSRYFSAVNRKGLLQRSALYERPWFLICGTGKSGKSSLLRGSGLSFPMRYPSDRDGVVVEGGNQIMWYFGNEAVWIDSPGVFMEEGGRDDWQSLMEALNKVRPECPLDGVALVVNISEVLNADDQYIKELAQRLRGRIDDCIARWGIEFPVYLLFNRSDEIPGFNEYFGDQIVSGNDQIFGATIAQKKGEAVSARMTFAEEFGVLCKSLNDFRLDRLHKERDPARKRMICRFVIHFQGFQQKLAVLAAELFKSSSYIGKPIFRGFYFTSCREKPAGQDMPRPSSNPEVSATITNHPLNPQRAMGVARAAAPASGGGTGKKEVQSHFVLPLFREIMVRDKPLVKATRGRTRRERIRYFSIVGALAVVALLFTGYLATSYVKIANFYGEASAVLEKLPSEGASLFDQYKALDVMQDVMKKLQKYDDRVPLSMGIGLYRGKPLLENLKKSFFFRVRRCMIAPAVKYLEYDIRGRAEDFGELSGEDYDKLYRSLKAYLSISEAVSGKTANIDTVFLRPMLFDAIRQSILSSTGASRLPERIETVLVENMGLLLTYLKRGEFPVIQENQKLVAEARSRLRRLPGAPALYEAVIGQIRPTVAEITLDELIGRQGAGVLSSDKAVSILFTQQGWEQSVSGALKEAAENPYKVDWVIGLKKEDVPDAKIDKGQLLDDMQNAYLVDFKKQWCAFIGSIDIAPFADLSQSARMIQKLVSEQSELQKLLEAVGAATKIKNESLLEKAGGGLLAAAAKNKGTAAMVKKADKTADRISLPFGRATPFDDLNALFDQLRAFAASSGGSLSGYAGYKEKALILVDKLNGIPPGGDDQALTVFTGKDDDPLYAGWKYTKNMVGVMPEELADGLGALLLKPFELTGAAASVTLTRVFNERWKAEVIKPYTSRLSGRYPFVGRGEDASWSETMDYFRPVTGVFWGFYERVLSSYVIRASSGWMVRQVGGMQLDFNPGLSSALTAAEVIRNIFYKPDGTIRVLDVSFFPSSSNKTPAKLAVDGQVIELSGGKGGRIAWPFEGQGRTSGASLKLQAGKDFWQDITFGGPWGLMKLISAAKVNKINNSAFYAKWQVNVQNTYMLYFEARVQVTSADHPFTDALFQKFSCPDHLVVVKKPPQD